MTKQRKYVESDFEKLFKESKRKQEWTDDQLEGQDRSMGVICDPEIEMRKAAKHAFGIGYKMSRNDVLYNVLTVELVEAGKALIDKGGRYKSPRHAANALRRSGYNCFCKSFIGAVDPEEYLGYLIEAARDDKSINSASFAAKRANQKLRRKLGRELDRGKTLVLKRRYIKDQLRAKCGQTVHDALQAKPSAALAKRLVDLRNDLAVVLVIATGKSQADVRKLRYVGHDKEIGKTRVQAAVRRTEKLGLELHRIYERDNIISTVRSIDDIYELIDDTLGLKPLIDLIKSELSLFEWLDGQPGTNDAA